MKTREGSKNDMYFNVYLLRMISRRPSDDLFILYVFRDVLLHVRRGES